MRGEHAVFLGLLDRDSAVRALELDRHADVLRLGRQVGQAEAERIGADFFHHVDRVDAIALRLRHPLAVGVENRRVDVNLVERDLAHVVQTGEHHAGHPQREDVAIGDQHAGRIVVAQLGRVFGPAERRVGPQRRAEPGVEHVGILHQLVPGHGVFRQVFVARADEPLVVLGVAAPGDVFASGERPAQVVLAGGRRVPDRNAVPPPELAADRPVALFREPVEIAAGKARGRDADAAVADRVHGHLREPFHAHEPLVGQVGLDGRLRAVGVGQLDFAVLDFFEQAQRVEVSHHALAGRHDFQALVRPGVGVERAVGVEDVDHRQVLPAGHVVVVGIVGRRDLDRTAAQFGFGPDVGHQRNLAVQQRQADLAPGQGHVAQHDQLPAAASCGARRALSSWAASAGFSFSLAEASFSPSSRSAAARAASGSGCTATAVSPSIVSGRVVAMLTKAGSPGRGSITG